MTAKEQIIDLFRKNVKGKSPNVENRNPRHDGKKGHWLEEQFGISANADNEADLWGYELKNETTSKTTFGDWSANIMSSLIHNTKHFLKGKTKQKNKIALLKSSENQIPKKETAILGPDLLVQKLEHIIIAVKF